LQEQWRRQNRFLTQALIFSGALNIGLLTSFCYLIFKEKQSAVVFELPPKEERSQKSETLAILPQLAAAPYAQLVEMLENKERVEAGYKKRDLALASLVEFHHIDLEKALAGAAVQKRGVSFLHGSELASITLYPGLSEDQHRAFADFIKKEKFPLTTKGLFYELKQMQDPLLVQTFYLTPEYTLMSTLFNRGGLPLPPAFLIELIRQGDFEVLNKFCEEERVAQDFSPLRLKLLLTSYIRCRSQLAAKILLQWDKEYILKQFEDKDLVQLIELFPQKNDQSVQFLREVLATPRSDAVWKRAEEKLKSFEIVVQEELQKVSTPARKIHVVGAGDSLWKLAKKYKVSIESIREANHLETDKLRIGQKLQIP
jgi:LysM repeat protein